MNYNVAMQDGRVVSGIIADESAAAITLKRAEGRNGCDRQGSNRDDLLHGHFADA